MIRARTKARLKINEQLRGDKTNLRVVGCLLFKEWDAAESRWYYWEEWELTGFDDYDCWVEYDHDTQKAALYEPVHFVEKIDPEKLRVGMTMTLTDEAGQARQVTVNEAGRGTIVKIQGKNAYQVFEGEEMIYATLSSSANGKQTLLTLEKYNNREYDVYQKTRLSVPRQKALFGKRIVPIQRNWEDSWWLYVIVFVIALLIAIFDSDTSDNTGSRSIYGGGSSGVGK